MFAVSTQGTNPDNTSLYAVMADETADIDTNLDPTIGGYASGQAPLQPTVAGRTLDVSAGGEAGVDWANVGSPTTTVGLSGTTVKAVTDRVTANADQIEGVDATDQIRDSILSDATRFQGGRIDAAISSRSTYAGGAVASVTAGVTVSTNNDKTGYALSGAAIQAIWDALTSALTVAGSIGKRIADNLDAAITSRSSHTAVNVRTEMDANSTKLANLDATVSSRSTYAGADTAGTATLLARLTAIRAGLLDNLDAAISSRSTYAGGAVASVTGTVNANLVSADDGVVEGSLTGAFFTAIAAAVWGAATRTLSAFGFTVNTNPNATETAIKAATDNLPSDPADQSIVIAATDAVMNRLGAPSGASISADVLAVKGDTAAIKAKTDNLPTDPADHSLIMDRLGVPVTSIAADIANIPTAPQNADALLDRANGVEPGLTLRESQRLQVSVLAGKLSGAGSGEETFRNFGDTKDRVVATVDASGNRTAITSDVT